MDKHSPEPRDDRASRVGRWVFWGFALVAAYFLYTEHRAHLFGALPYLLLAACPLMHVFHHRHGHHHHEDLDDAAERDPAAEAAASGSPTHHKH